MTGTEGQPAEPTTEVVDNIDLPGGLNMEDAIVDDNGTINQYHDRANNKVYIRKGYEDPFGVGNKSDDDDSGDGDDSDAGDTGASGDQGKGGAKPGAKTDDEGPVEEYENLAHHMLKLGGYEGDTVKIDGQEIKIADLTESQQLSIMEEQFSEYIDKKDAEIVALKARTPELKFEDAHAQQIVEYLKKGGDIKALAKEILSSDPAAQAAMLSDEEVVKLKIQKQNPSFSAEDVKDEYDDMSEKARARHAKAYREEMKNMKPDLTNLTQAQKDQMAAAELKTIKDYEAEVTKTKAATAKIQEIAGIKISKEMSDWLNSQTIPKDHKSNSIFVDEILSNPDKMFKLKWWDAAGEKILKQTQEYFYKKGLAEGQKGKEKLSDTPVIKEFGGSRRQAGNGQMAPPSKSIDEMNAQETQAWIDSGINQF